MALNKTQAAAIALVRSRLDPNHPEFTASEEVANALRDFNLKCYLDAWVIPLIDYLTNGPSYFGHDTDIRSDYAQRTARVEAKRHWDAMRAAAVARKNAS